MNRYEFLKAMGYLSAGCNKALPEQSLEVYFDCLGDLSFDGLMIAAKRVLLEHRYANFPTIAELREAAAQTMRGKVIDLSPAEAWEMAWRAVARIDPEVGGSFSRVTSGLPGIVVEAMRAFGVHALCYGEEPVGVVRGQFLKIYEQLAARDKRAALLPASTKHAIEAIGQTTQLPAKVTRAIEGIGQKIPE